LFEDAGDAPLPLIVILPRGLVKRGDPQMLAWAAFANIDPERDVMFNETPEQVNGRWVMRRHPRHIAVDATPKGPADGFTRDWPNMQVHPTGTLTRVKQLLAEKGIEMPTDFLP
jgi:hypothetical protein